MIFCQLVFYCCLQFSRDWFADRFEAIAKSILTSAEKDLRHRLEWTVNLNHKDPESGVTVSPQMVELLKNGIKVITTKLIMPLSLQLLLNLCWNCSGHASSSQWKDNSILSSFF